MLRSFIHIMLISTVTSLTHAQPKNSDDAIRYTKVANGYVMVLRRGDNVMAELEKFASSEKIPSANFTGMGFVNITFGFFDNRSKTFIPKEFEDLELASMHGTIATKDGKPSIHAHGAWGQVVSNVRWAYAGSNR